MLPAGITLHVKDNLLIRDSKYVLCTFQCAKRMDGG